MQASELWAGHEYAYVDGRPKGVETPMHGQRVKVLRVVKRKEDSWAERQTTFAEVEFVDRNPPYQREVRARDIVDFWDEYKDRYDHILAERKKREEERQARIEKEAAKREAILEMMERLVGVKPQAVHTSYRTFSVTFNNNDFEETKDEPEL